LASQFLEGHDSQKVFNKTMTFLPATRTWIEYQNLETGTREAMLLINEAGSAARAAGFVWLIGGSDWIGAAEKHGTLMLDADEIVPVLTASNREFGETVDKGRNYPQLASEIPDIEKRGLYGKLFVTAEVYALLGMINTPRVFQRLAHEPHAGLQRKMVAAKPLVGKFPLGAWTEILLKVPAPKGEQSVKGDGGYLSGERALHWCRAHLRYRLGQWEIVSDHWRGNPALGMKQSRYRLELNRENEFHGK
jgi:hypothetical protein